MTRKHPIAGDCGSIGGDFTGRSNRVCTIVRGYLGTEMEGTGEEMATRAKRAKRAKRAGEGSVHVPLLERL